MAYRDGAELHRRTSRRRHPLSPPPIAHYDWQPAGETVFDSMPYRRPRDLIQGPDERTSSMGRSRSVNTPSGVSASLAATMPRTPKAAPYRRGRVPVDNGSDSYDEEPPSSGRDRERESSRRGRRPRSSHHSRTRRIYESRRSSRYSQSASETESDEESETSVSTQEEKRERRRDRDRRVREKYEKSARQTVVERRRPAADDKTPRRRRQIKKIIYMEEDGSTEPTPRQSMDERSRSPSRHRSHISRPALERHYSRQRSHSSGRRSSHHRASPRTYEISKPPNSSKKLAYEIHPSRGDSDLIQSRNSRRRPSQTEMPPKCCSENIALKHVDHLFSAEFKKKWNRKFQEYSARNRIYCPSRKCGAWIKPHYIRNEGGRKYGKCGKCRTKVCCSCNGRWHSSRECPNDEETTKFLDQAKDEGWKRCYKCNHMVELKEGCNHMTCVCGAQFCMWRSCDCPWFNYEAADADQLHDMQVPAALQRMERLDLTESSRSMRPTAASSAPPPRSRSQEYDSRLMRRFQENRDEDLARTLQSYEIDDVYDRGYGDIVDIGNTAGHFMNDDYRREPDKFVSAPIPPAPTPPAAFERPAPTDYMSGVNRARGVPPDLSGQRLAERFSEFRSSPGGPRPGMMAPLPVPPLGPATAPPMGPLPMAGPMAMGPPPPLPLLRRHTIEEELYNMTTRPSERVVPGRIVHDYEREAAVHAPRSRRRMREEPRSSTLAGLTGVGRGMNRVHEWRNHVRPGMPEGEPTAMT
ncbi:IBR domain-containing protein [Colletotrichum incanum]|nr:IBR domain-containing protein [Colletotrichum incanum]